MYIGKKLFEQEKLRVLDKFFEDYFSLAVNTSKKIAQLIEKYNIIDKAGLFFPVLVTELTFLGEKVFFKRKDDLIIKEVTNFIEFLKNYANREIGEEKLLKTFEGAYCRSGIMIIARWFKVGDIKPYIKYAKKLIDKKIEDIYLIGPDYEKNVRFINEISSEIQKCLNLEKYMSKKYRAKIKIHGERKQVNNYLVLLRNPEAIRYYDEEYQKKFMVSSSHTQTPKTQL